MHWTFKLSLLLALVWTVSSLIMASKSAQKPYFFNTPVIAEEISHCWNTFNAKKPPKTFYIVCGEAYPLIGKNQINPVMSMNVWPSHDHVLITQKQQLLDLEVQLKHVMKKNQVIKQGLVTWIFKPTQNTEKNRIQFSASSAAELVRQHIHTGDRGVVLIYMRGQRGTMNVAFVCNIEH